MVNGLTAAIITRFKDRFDHLQETLPTWVSMPGIDYITITDWDSGINLKPFLDSFNDPRITLLQVQNKPLFERAKAHNTGIRFTNANIIILLDCDVKIISSKFYSLIESWNRYAASFLTIENRFRSSSLFGSCVFFRDIWMLINGFYEGFKDYGNEDTDFYLRLEKIGLVDKRVITDKMLQHINHDDSLRVKYHFQKSVPVSVALNQLVKSSNSLPQEKQRCIVNGKEIIV
jgi:predicted glycosyltransferase involved in capsule biosynthesis